MSCDVVIFYCLLMLLMMINYSRNLPVMLQSKRKVGVSPLNSVLGPSLLELLGMGIVMVIGL